MSTIVLTFECRIRQHDGDRNFSARVTSDGGVECGGVLPEDAMHVSRKWRASARPLPCRARKQQGRETPRKEYLHRVTETDADTESNAPQRQARFTGWRDGEGFKQSPWNTPYLSTYRIKSRVTRFRLYSIHASLSRIAVNLA